MRTVCTRRCVVIRGAGVFPSWCASIPVVSLVHLPREDPAASATADTNGFSDMTGSRRNFGMPTCCGGPEASRPDGDSSATCYKTADGEVITGDSSSSKSRPIVSDIFDEKVSNDGLHVNGVMARAEANQVLQAQGRVPPADFSGSWRCERVSGDMESFLADMGLGVALRKAAETANYGAGVQVQNISQMGDLFEVENVLRTPVTMQFRVGDGEQNTVDQVGKPIIVNPRWEGSALYVSSRTETGDLIADSRRYIEGETMVIQFTSPQGTVVERIFARI